MEKNGQKDAYVRPIAWRGSEMMGVSAQNNTIHLAIATWEWPSYFDPAQRQQVEAAIDDARRSVGLHRAHRAVEAAVEALKGVDDGEVGDVMYCI